MVDELSARRQIVLGLVVREYIARGIPVGSRAILDLYDLGVSPATVRNEMAVLEELGYLTHPHTSAGRMPTEEGYRYFVEHLLGDTMLPSEDRLQISHQFGQARAELDQWVKLAVAVLAHTVRNIAVATPPKASSSRLKRVELIEIRDGIVLMVLVTHEGSVKQQMLNLPVAADELQRLNNELNEHLAGRTSEQMRGQATPWSPLAADIVELIIPVMARLDMPANEIYREGLSHALTEPEFAEGDMIRRVVEIIETRPLLETILAETRATEGVQVIIGGEGRWRELNNISLVLSRYGVDEGASGVLGVLGPLRMPYGRTISAVRYVSAMMSELLRDFYG